MFGIASLGWKESIRRHDRASLQRTNALEFMTSGCILQILVVDANHVFVVAHFRVSAPAPFLEIRERQQRCPRCGECFANLGKHAASCVRVIGLAASSSSVEGESEDDCSTLAPAPAAVALWMG